MSRGRARRGERGEYVGGPERGEALLANGISVGADCTAKQALIEQDQGGTEGLGVEEVGECDSGQVSAVSDEQGLARVNKLGLDLGNTVLFGGMNGT